MQVDEIVSDDQPRRAIRKLGRLAGNLPEEQRPVAELMIAQLHTVLGEREVAEAILAAVDLTIQTLRIRPEEAVRMQASVLAGRALLITMTDPDAAIVLLERASEAYKSVDDPWKAGAIECNLAVAAAYKGVPEVALRHLLDAERLSQLRPPTSALLESRLRAVEVNRAVARSMMGEDEQYLEAAIAARATASVTQDFANLGRIDLNLANYYRMRGQHGSQLRAATSAQEAFEAAGFEELAIASRVEASKALISLGRLDGLEEFLVGTLGSKLSGEGTRPEWWLASREALSALRRAIRPDYDSALPEISGRIPRTPMMEAAAQMGLLVDDALEFAARGETGPPPPELEQWMGQLRTHGVSWAVNYAEVMRNVLVAVYAGESDIHITAEQEEALNSAGASPEATRDMVRSAALLRGYDSHRDLEIVLGEVADHQVMLAKQISESDRSALHDRVERSLGRALMLSRVLDEPQTVFELLETGRRDLSEWAQDFAAFVDTPFHSLPSRALTGSPSVQAKSDAMTTPSLITVNGRSAISDVRPRRVRGGDAASIRTELAGAGSTWLSMRLVGRELVWGWLADDNRVWSGAYSLDERFHRAWLDHDRSLPNVRQEHFEIAGNDAPAWAVDLVAAAMAARGTLVARPDLAEQCLDALPSSIARRARDAMDRMVEGDGAYRLVADVVLPVPVRDWIRRNESNATLLVSVPAELASIPFPLLDLGDEGLLGEHVLTVLTPPSNLATLVASRSWQHGAVRSVLAISNPTDDLKYADTATPGLNSLTGWSQTARIERVATRSNVIARCQALSIEGSYGLSYSGHIRPGSPSEPGLSALVLASTRAGGRPAYMTARDLRHGVLAPPGEVYLGGCESTGFGTGLEWASIAGGFLAAGTSSIVAHAWPILDTAHAARVDDAVASLMSSGGFTAKSLLALQRRWIDDWIRSPGSAIAPHHWAGLNPVGRFL
jgi:tetratricopeptide (TPR) repeat protein